MSEPQAAPYCRDGWDDDDWKDHAQFLERLIKARHGPGWEHLTILKAEEYREQNAALREQVAMLEETLAVAHHIEGTFWEALKPLGLTEINVANPGQHVTDLITENTTLRQDLDAVKARALSVNRGLTADNLTMRDALALAVAAKEAAEGENGSPYCPTCGSCGEPECCPPNKCKHLRCRYGDNYVRDYEQTQALLEDALREMRILKHTRPYGKPERERHMSLLQERGAAETALAEAQEREKAWEETAAQFARNQEYYRGLVLTIGEMFGVAARTSDDGSIQDEVLCAKVPELVTESQAALREAGEALTVWVDWFGGIHDSTCPEDDTCSCSGKPANDRVEHVFALPAMVQALAADGGEAGGA